MPKKEKSTNPPTTKQREVRGIFSRAVKEAFKDYKQASKTRDLLRESLKNKKKKGSGGKKKEKGSGIKKKEKRVPMSEINKRVPMSEINKRVPMSEPKGVPMSELKKLTDNYNKNLLKFKSLVENK